MSLRCLILRLFQPKTERERMNFRMAISCAAAHAEDLTRSAQQVLRQRQALTTVTSFTKGDDDA